MVSATFHPLRPHRGRVTAGSEDAGTMRERDDRLEAFEAEYRALCEKHGLMIVYDGSYMPSEADDFDPEAFEGWRLRYPYA